MYKTMPVIALEEHYWDPEMVRHFSAAEGKSPVGELLKDVDSGRLRAMDAAGIDVQVLSHAAPSAQKMSPDICVDAARRANDRLAETCVRHPTRFAGFAALPTPVPDKAVEELERCVTQLGFKGAMIHGLTNGVFLDDKRFWPILEKAQALGVPLYMHPSIPHPDVMRVYYDDYAQEFPMVIRAAWGFTVETATAAIRLILSRAFESFPDLDIILGHFGETLPFVLWRINQALARSGQGSMNFREQFTRHFHVTTSGAFSTPALVCTMLELGIDRIMFSVDYPYVGNEEGREWIETLQLSPDDMRKLLGGNAQRLLKLPVDPSGALRGQSEQVRA